MKRLAVVLLLVGCSGSEVSNPLDPESPTGLAICPGNFSVPQPGQALVCIPRGDRLEHWQVQAMAATVADDGSFLANAQANNITFHLPRCDVSISNGADCSDPTIRSLRVSNQPGEPGLLRLSFWSDPGSYEITATLGPLSASTSITVLPCDGPCPPCPNGLPFC